MMSIALNLSYYIYLKEIDCLKISRIILRDTSIILHKDHKGNLIRRLSAIRKLIFDYKLNYAIYYFMMMS